MASIELLDVFGAESAEFSVSRELLWLRHGDSLGTKRKALPEDR